MARFQMKVTTEGGQQETIPVDPNRCLVFGRLESCDLGLNDPLLSRRHCEIRVTARGAILKDLDSHNGTYLNGARISEEILLPGDHIQIGRTRVLFCGEGTESSRPTALAIPENPFEEPHPPQMNIAPCGDCTAPLTNHDLLAMKAFQSQAEEKTYCLPCFCDGRGDFPPFGRYRIYRKLGSGAMATVYLAIHLTLRKPVALKVFREQSAIREKSLQRFLREGRTGARLIHPKIVQFIDAGLEQERHFIAMEFVDGLDSRQRLSRAGFFRVLDSLILIRQIAEALDFAHGLGAVHRDIKPENLLISRKGEAKLTDFGLAKFLGDQNSIEITESGSWVGTLAYTPPEQLLDSRSVDARSDLYSLCATLYEFVSGKIPFPGEFNRETIHRIRHELPPIREIASQPISEGLMTLLETGMAKDPGDRFPSATALGEALDQETERALG